jgi:hypothetical protein
LRLSLSHTLSLFVFTGDCNWRESNESLQSRSPLKTNNGTPSDSRRRMKKESFNTLIHDIWDSADDMDRDYLFWSGIVTDKCHQTVFSYCQLTTKNDDVACDSASRMKNESFYTLNHAIWDSPNHKHCHYLCWRWIVTEESQMNLFSCYPLWRQIITVHVIVRFAWKSNHSTHLFMLYGTHGNTCAFMIPEVGHCNWRESGYSYQSLAAIHHK